MSQNKQALQVTREQHAERDTSTCSLVARIARRKLRACSQAKNKFKCLPTVLEKIFYLEIDLGLYFDCTSAMVLELNLTLEPNSV